MTGHEPKQNFTAVIYVQVGNAVTPTSALYRLVKAVTKSQFVDRVSGIIQPLSLPSYYNPSSSRF